MSTAQPDAPARAVARVVVAVDPARAFAVFTGEIDRWWGEAMRPGSGPDRAAAGTLRFDPGPSGRLVEVFDDGGVFEVGPVHAWEPGAWLVFEWRQGNFAPEQTTRVEVRFEACAEGTRVTLVHTGFEGLPRGHGARHGHDDDAGVAALFAEFWSGQLASLADGGR